MAARCQKPIVHQLCGCSLVEAAAVRSSPEQLQILAANDFSDQNPNNHEWRLPAVEANVAMSAHRCPAEAVQA